MLVDDSAVVRALTRRWLDADPRVEVVRVSVDGEQALKDIAICQPDVVILDVEMPRMDGLAALPGLRKAAPGARVIMASTLTSRGATTTIKALQLGAADYIAKPEATALGAADAYRRDLIDKIVALGERSVGAVKAQAGPIRLRPQVGRGIKPAVLVVAASTGGPAALQAFFTPIASRINVPTLIVQHMPATFMSIFAAKLGESIGRACREARDGEPLGPASFLMAAGDRHLRIARAAAGCVVRLDQEPPVNFCRPAADPLFESAAAAYGQRVLAIVLTGMGHDGRAGSAKIVGAGGRVAVQDEASSIVWGMPGSIAAAGYAEAVEPIEQLGALTLGILNGDAA